MLIIITEHTVKTRKFGVLKISALSTKEIADLNKLLSQKINDKEIFIQFLHRLLRDPELTKEDLKTLSDNVLIRIGKEIIKANRLDSKHKQILKEQRVSFYTKFRKLLEQEDVAWKKIIDKQKLPFQSISEKLKTAFMSPTSNMIKDIRRREEEFRRLSSINSHLIETMNAYKSFETQIKSFVDAFKMQEIQMKSAIDNINNMLRTSKIAEDLWRKREEFNKLANLKAQAVNLIDNLDIRNSISSIIDAFNSNAIADSITKLHNLSARLPLQDLNLFQSLANDSSLQAFIKNSIRTAEDIFEEPEFLEEFEEKDIEEAKIIIENAKNNLSKLNLFSGKQLSILGIYLYDFINGTKDINEALEKGKLESWNALMIISVLILKLCAVIYALQQDAKKQ